MTTQSIHNRAILIGLRIKSWSAKKYDKQVSADTAAAHGADASAGRYNKNLLPSTVRSTKQVERSKGKGKGKKTETITIETNSHKELMAHIAAVRVWVYDQTLAWDDDGWVILPMANYTPFMDGIRERKNTFDRLLRAFLADYPQLVTDARRLLNGMFKESDYPADIESRFGWDVEKKPVPEADFRVSLPADEIKALKASAEARIQSAVESAQADAVQRLFTCVERIHEKLAEARTRKGTRTVQKAVGQEQVGEYKNGKPKMKTIYEKVAEEYEEKTTEVFRDTLITNAREVCEVLTRLNIADDLKLEKFRRETEKLAQVEPETIRNNAHVAAATAETAQSILDAMTAVYGKSLFGGK